MGQDCEQNWRLMRGRCGASALAKRDSLFDKGGPVVRKLG